MLICAKICLWFTFFFILQKQIHGQKLTQFVIKVFIFIFNTSKNSVDLHSPTSVCSVNLPDDDENETDRAAFRLLELVSVSLLQVYVCESNLYPKTIINTIADEN